MVYVLDKDGHPLMPTRRHGKVRRMLRNNEAKVLKRCPFTIQLLYETTEYIQEVKLGIDAGSKHIGVSVTTETKVLYEADVELRNDIVELLSVRRELRNSRRNRKTRYRAPRFDNRKRSDKWLAPSVRQKIDTHVTVIRKVTEILPGSEIIVETASFDIQKIKNPDVAGVMYQQGEQMDFWNVREYVLFRDGHQCQCCKGRSKDPVLNVHHIESRKTGGNAPNNLITLCETCHKGYHNGTVKLPGTIHRGMRFSDAAFMGIMRWALLDKLKEIYGPSGVKVRNTYGYITKITRIEHGLSKEHYVDARCISGNPAAEPMKYVYYQKKVRCHNRQIHKCKILKGGYRKSNQASYEVMGFRLYDKVKYQKKEYFIFGRRSSGYFDIRTLSGEKVNKGSISHKKLQLVEKSRYILTKCNIIYNIYMEKISMQPKTRNLRRPNENVVRRTKESLEYALSILQSSPVAPWITHIYLYGSCARSEQRFDSDVDILVEFSENLDKEKYRSDIIHLKGAVSPIDIDLPVVDMHTVIGNAWRDSKLLYYKNVKRDGIDVWETIQKTAI